MLVIGLLISTLLGFSLLNFISLNFSLPEKAGLSFLLGIALQTLLMLFIDALGIRLDIASIWTISFIAILLLNLHLFLHRKEIFSLLKRPAFNWREYNLVWLFFILLTVYLEYMNFEKCLFFPTFDRDSLAGFDTIGWIVSREHTFSNLSIFQHDYVPGINSAASYITYMPMIQLSYAYVYMLGEETSKIIPALVYLSFLIAFYGAACRFSGRTAAAFATFFMMITPEMLAFSSLSATNVIHASYASLGVVYTVLWWRDRTPDKLIVAAALMACNIWVRTEGIVFIGAAVIIFFIDALQKRSYKSLLIFGIIAISPVIVWSIYMKMNGIYAESIAITRPFWDYEKISVIGKYFESHFMNTTFYGLSFVAFLLAVVCNGWFIVKKRDQVHLLLMILLSLSFYMIVLYQIDYKWDSIENVLAYSAKRFLFCFIPLLWLYVIAGHTGHLLFQKLDDFLTFKNEKVKTLHKK